MCASDCKLKMEVRCSLFKLLLFQMLVTWCGAKHVTIDDVPRPRLRVEAADQDVQDSIRNLIHTGIYSHRHLDPSQVQVVHPVKVTHDGALVSHAVQHEHEHGHARARRDLHEVEHLQPHSLHYNLTVDGKHLRLDLRPSVTFITPAMIVERHNAGQRTRQHPRPEATACHYTGNVRGQPTSRVALSACDGLAGLLQTEHGEYWIEPSNQLPADSTEKRAHVIFRRSAVDKVAAFHREKRAVDSNPKNINNGNNIKHDKNTQRYSRRKGNGKGSRESREERDRRRREFLEKRRKDLAAMRRNPVEYRRQHPNLRMEERRMHSYSKSSSVEGSMSREQKSIELQKKNDKSFEKRLKRLMKRRKKRRSKNCATKQPPYQWKEKNFGIHDKEDMKKAKNGKHHRRNNHHHNVSHHKEHNNNSTRRSTRSVSRPRHVEVLLVADRSMTDFHNNRSPHSLETYLLMIMNMVSTLYMDPSIGNYIKVVVVKIILVEEINAADELEVTTNADVTLASFCRWQQQLNPEDDTNPHHHDVAILVTRTDICSQNETPCSTLGVAHVAGMCKPDLSCSLNEDNGIMLAHTITHELGHNFGLYHDTEKIGCQPRDGTTLHIMTPIFDSETAQVAWSRCSKRDVTNFLDAGLGECLSDRPSQEEYVYPEVPAGVLFDAASQCHLQFGVEALVCAKSTELCRHLWCLVNNVCISTLRAAAPGTTCDIDMWCQNQTCVPKTPSPAPRNGGWGPWSDWSECSRTCGAGVSTQSRECNNPEPYHNGNYCIGDRSRHRICNTDPCPITEPSFREVQCSKHNNITLNKETIAEWIPYFDQDKPCDLLCVPRDSNETEMLGGFVADGTPCRQTEGSRDMCIAGVCYKVGCDWIVNSDAEEDACGVCGGDGSECKTVQGIYNKGTTRQSGYSEVAVIPAGSRNVKIQEKVSPGNYISIASAKSKKMYINGARNATLLEYFVAGAQAIYERDRDWEKVRITGPITEDIKVYQRIFRGRHRNPGVSYQYTVDRQQLENQYSYRLSEWTPCSVTCGIGHSRRYFECIDPHRRVVEQSRCYHIESPRQNVLMKRCRQPACPTPPKYTHWWVGAWTPCSKLCHMPGEQATKQRNVYCVDKQTNKVVEDSKCDLPSKPMTSIICADVPAC